MTLYRTRDGPLVPHVFRWVRRLARYIFVDLPPKGPGIDLGCISAGVVGSDRLLRCCLSELLLLLASETPLVKGRQLSMLGMLTQGVPLGIGPDAVVGLRCGEGDGVSG